MAKIQLGNFGNVLPETRQHSLQSSNSAGVIGSVLGTVSNVLDNSNQQKIQENQLANQEIERQKKGEDDILFTNIYAKAGADLSLLDDDVNMQIKQGVSLDDARMYREEGVQNITQKYQYDVPERYQDRFAGALDAKAYESAASLMPQFRQSQQQAERVTLLETMQTALKSEDKAEYKAVMQIGIEGSNLSAAEKQDLWNKANNSWDVDKSSRELEGYFRSNDIAGIQENFTSEKLKEKYGDLTQDQITAIQKQAYAKTDQINRSIETERKKLDNDAKDAVSEMKQIVSSGGIPSVDVLTGLVNRTRGTEHEVEIARLAEVSDGVNNFLRQPPDVRGTLLSRMQSDQKTKSSGDPVFDKWKLDLYNSAHQQSLSREKNDVAGNYNVVTGKELVNPPATSIAMGDSKAIAALSENIKTIQAFNGDRGITGNLNPLTQQTQTELREHWAKAPAEQRLQMISNLKKASKGVPDAYSPMVNSVAGASNSYRLAGAIAQNPRYVNTVALPIVKGQTRLEKKEVNFDTKPVENAVSEYFADLGLPSTGINVYKDAAKAYYAETLHQSQAKKDANGKYTFDKELFEDALIAVSGGRYIEGNNKVLRPYGVSDKSFRDQLQTYNDTNSRKYGTQRNYFKDARIVQDQDRPNEYFFYDGFKKIKTPDNQGFAKLVIH